MNSAPTNKKTSKSYSVGQVLYLFSTTKKTIIPVQIVIKDKQVIEKLGSSGPVEQITYRVILPNDKNKLHVLTELEGEVYLSLNELQTFMEQRMKEQISKLILATKEKAKESFGRSAGLVEDEEESQDDPELIESDMDEFLEEAIEATEKKDTNRKSKYKDFVASDDEMEQQEAQLLTLPDGQVIKARSITIGNDFGR